MLKDIVNPARMPVILVVIFFCVTVHSAYASSPEDGAIRRASIGETFDGEALKYNITFWWFKNAAVGDISLKRDGNDYLITMEAETLGVIGWVTKYRKDIYRSYVEEIDGGKRFRLKVFEKEVNIGGRIRRGVTVMDYDNMVMKWKSWGGGKEDKEEEEPIPSGVLYDDPLTAFYNFRYGAYGPIEMGREYRIPTFPKDGVSDMYVKIVTEEEMQKRADNPSLSYLADIRIDKELFGSQTGDIEALFSKDFLPVGGVVKDMIFFGDVVGRLVETTARMDFSVEASPFLEKR